MTSRQPDHGVKARQFGQWEVVGWLGGGGLGDVYEVRNAADEKAAVKVFHQDRHSKVVHRYQPEIDFLVSDREYPGILPLIDFELADDDDALVWYATPLATPLDRADSQLSDPYDVIQAVANAATTLADLSLQDLHHRNVKPTNMFLLDGKPVIGDIALIAPDEAIDLRAEQRITSSEYTAPEMKHGGAAPDVERADVYSLAKTLSVLLGEQAQDVDQLDALLTQALNDDPRERPNMARLSGQLVAIAERFDEPISVEPRHELDAAAGRLNRVLTDEPLDESRRAELTHQAKATYAALVASTLGVALTSLFQVRSMKIEEITLPEKEMKIPSRPAFMLHRGANAVTATVPGAVLTINVHAGFWDGIQSELLKVSVRREWGEANISMRIKWLETGLETDVWTFGWQQTLRAARSARSFNELSRQTSLHLTKAYELLSNWVERRELPDF